MQNHNSEIAIMATTVVANVIPLMFAWKRVNYRKYYMAIFVATLVFFYVALRVYRSDISKGIAEGQFIFLLILSLRNLFYPLDRRFNLISRGIVLILVVFIILLLILREMFKGPFAFG